jgi:hypothetical protein
VKKGKKELHMDHLQEQAVRVFSGAMLSQLRGKVDFLTRSYTEDEMLLALAKEFEEIRKANVRRDTRCVQEHAADLANLAMKCFRDYGK